MARGWSSSLALGAIVAVLVAAASSPSVARAAVVEHTFNVGNMSISQLCEPEITIATVNGQLPGPTIHASEGDTVVVHLVNQSPYNMTIHWHGIFQRGTPWADGPEMVTQCPVQPGGNYTYRFNVTAQEGTLWWHAHSSVLRATVYGALIIKPRNGSYPFSPKPDGEMVLMLGEWWDTSVYELHQAAFLAGKTMPPANAYTINGRPGDQYNCFGPTNTTNRFEVRRNETYLLRIINAALNTPLFFKVAEHSFTVVAADACYTTPYKTDVVMVSPGQTVDALMVAAAAGAGRRYYMVAYPYNSGNLPTPDLFNPSITTAIVEYVDGVAGENATLSETPFMPQLPNDTITAHTFLSNLTALVLPGSTTVPLTVDTRMFVTMGLGVSECMPEQTFCNRSAPPVFSSSMNNASFILPKGTSMLEAHYTNTTAGVYTRDFPDTPPLVFDYTSVPDNIVGMLQFTTKSTKVRTLKFNETVEMVLQNTRLIAKESHPMHLHGFNFFILAQGFGNYNATEAVPKFNLVNPQERNTVAVPTGGWAVIRFVADNPGMWYMHCHFDAHVDLGLGMVFEVQDGPTPETSLPPPPKDLPKC